MFSITAEDQINVTGYDAHMAASNPFGLDEDDELPEMNDDGFEEIKLQKRDGSLVTVNTAAEADNRETNEGSEDTEDLNDWELIDDVDVEVDKNGFRPPDYLNDPFKDKWRNTV